MGFRFDSVVIGARDPQKLAAFYKKVFGFYETMRNDAWNDPADSVRLVAPNFDGHAISFLFTKCCRESPVKNANDLGYTHLCFETVNMRALMKAVFDNGGELISTFPDWKLELGLYARDPEGNIIEAHVPMPESRDIRIIARALGAVALTSTGIASKRIARARFLHVNIVSPDWKESVKFYLDSFGGTRVGKQRDYDNDHIQCITGMPEHVHVVGEHVSMPGNSKSITTLEIFSYSKPSDAKPLTFEDSGILCLDLTASPENFRRMTANADSSSKTAVIHDPDGNLIRLHRS